MRHRVALCLSLALAVACSDDDGVSGDGDVFDPGSSTTLEGERSFASVDIPAGVTVTVTGDLTLQVSRDVVIAGTLVGDCVAVTIDGGAEVTITGTVRSSCASLPAAGAPGLSIVGDGGVRIEGATIRSSGTIEIKDDPSLTAASVANAAGVHPPLSAAPAGPVVIEPGNTLIDTSIEIEPREAKPGESGGRGNSGSSIVGLLEGDLTVRNVTLRAQDGGRGGPADTVPVPGPAGDGGSVSFTFGGDLAVEASSLESGGGGVGGSEDVAGRAGQPGPKAEGADANGGRGGDGGEILLGKFGAGPDGEVMAGSRLAPGDGGTGGAARAVGADGRDAGAQPAQKGGDAKAQGGPGGSVGRVVLTGVTLRGDVLPARSGNGGPAEVVGGKGGNGNAAFRDGAVGGATDAVGGEGGERIHTVSVSLTFPGNGGTATFTGGLGGNGAEGCPDEGEGGRGGSATGRGGAPGQDPDGAEGSPGDVILARVGNGGGGAPGNPGGSGGVPGADLITGPGARQERETPNFRPGRPGGLCLSGTYLETKATAAASPSSAASGSNVSVTLRVDLPAGSSLGAYDGYFRWNPAILQYQSKIEPPFGSPLTNVTAAGQGEIRFANFTFSGPSGSVTILTLNFRVVGSSGSSPLDIDVQSFTSGLLQTLAIQNNDGTFTVTSGDGGGTREIGLSRTSVSFSGTAGGSNPASQTFQVSNAGGGTLFTIPPGGDPNGNDAFVLSGLQQLTKAPVTYTATGMRQGG